MATRCMTLPMRESSHVADGGKSNAAGFSSLEPPCRHLERSPAHGPSGGVAPALGVIRPGREGELAFGIGENDGGKAEAVVSNRGIELGDLTKRALRGKHPGFHIRGGGRLFG